MRSLFASSPFSANFQPFRMAGPAMAGVLDDLEDTLNEITGLVDNLIEQVPVGALKSEYEQRRNACMKENIVKRYDCLYDLFQDIRKGVDGDTEEPPPRPVFQPSQTQQPEESGFPYLWVGAAGAAAIALIYFVVTSVK